MFTESEGGMKDSRDKSGFPFAPDQLASHSHAAANTLQNAKGFPTQ